MSFVAGAFCMHIFAVFFCMHFLARAFSGHFSARAFSLCFFAVFFHFRGICRRTFFPWASSQCFFRALFRRNTFFYFILLALSRCALSRGILLALFQLVFLKALFHWGFSVCFFFRARFATFIYEKKTWIFLTVYLNEEILDEISRWRFLD